MSQTNGRVEEPGVKPGGLQGLDRVLAIIDRLAEAPMHAKELADALGIKWSTAHRTLTHLRESGCLTRDEATGVYHIGPRLYFVGSSYLASLPIIHAARMELRVAANQTRTTVQLAARYGRRSMNLLVIESDKELIPRSTIDFHFPLHCGSKGQALLAFAEPGFVEWYLSQPLEPLTRHTVTDPDELRARLDVIRERDYAVTQGDVQLGSASVASPVRDASGAVIASVTLITPHNELEGTEATLVDVALTTARSLSLQLGWRPGGATVASAGRV
ncbi:MAG: IclR family transcriptional regulator [Solirubrobacteraceae bacterium]|nr:IclR family transcriptional regulator [Solirubrobacteraceae bacterium]